MIADDTTNVQEAHENVTESVSRNMKKFTGNVEEIKQDLTSRVETVAQKVPSLNTLKIKIRGAGGGTGG